MKLSLNAAHRAACTSALSFATGIWSNDFSAIERVPFAKSAARTMVGRETFGDRIRDAVMEFTDSKTHFDINATMLDAGSAANNAVAVGGSEPAAFEDSEAYALRDALELLARVHTGQVHILIEGRAKQSSDWGHILYDLCSIGAPRFSAFITPRSPTTRELRGISTGSFAGILHGSGSLLAG